MARLVDLVRDGSAPASMMRRAAQGVLSVSASEAIELLVVLAGHDELGTEAEETLGRWNQRSLVEVSSYPDTPPEVLRYILKLHGQRPAVVEALSQNPALPLEELEAIVTNAGAEVLRAMLRSERVRDSTRLLELIGANPEAAPARAHLDEWLEKAKAKDAKEAAEQYLAQHAEEVATGDQPFQLVPAGEGEDDPLNTLMNLAKAGDTAAAEPEVKKQLSLLQRLGGLRVGERIKLAMRGNREERMVLIRDRSKLVSMAVLESPKVTDSEMETFAAMKNIQEAVLRGIAGKRKWMKNYSVVKALANNPKTPIDVALPLLGHLLEKELRAISLNKNLTETIRKVALKKFRLKMEKNQGKE